MANLSACTVGTQILIPAYGTTKQTTAHLVGIVVGHNHWAAGETAILLFTNASPMMVAPPIHVPDNTAELAGSSENGENLLFKAQAIYPLSSLHQYCMRVRNLLSDGIRRSLVKVNLPVAIPHIMGKTVTWNSTVLNKYVPVSSASGLTYTYNISGSASTSYRVALGNFQADVFTPSYTELGIAIPKTTASTRANNRYTKLGTPINNTNTNWYPITDPGTSFMFYYRDLLFSDTANWQGYMVDIPSASNSEYPEGIAYPPWTYPMITLDSLTEVSGTSGRVTITRMAANDLWVKNLGKWYKVT